MNENSRPWRLLLVCTGNLCRSPMAAALARGYADERGRDIEVQSAGTMGLVDEPADKHAVAVCRELSLDLSEHRSQALTEDLVAWADFVLTMEYLHTFQIRERFPEVGERLLLLGTFGGMMEIADPLGGWKFQFRRTRETLRKCVEMFIDRLPPRKITAP